MTVVASCIRWRTVQPRPVKYTATFHHFQGCYIVLIDGTTATGTRYIPQMPLIADRRDSKCVASSRSGQADQHKTTAIMLKLANQQGRPKSIKAVTCVSGKYKPPRSTSASTPCHVSSVSQCHLLSEPPMHQQPLTTLSSG